MCIRSAARTDAQAIHDLHTRSVRELCNRYTEEQKGGWLADRTPEGYFPGIDRGEMFVYKRANRILGFSHIVPGEIVALFVSPDVARTGIGAALLKHGLARAQGDHGVVRLEATLNAVEFYESFGFVKTGVRSVRRGSIELPVVTMEMVGNPASPLRRGPR